MTISLVQTRFDVGTESESCDEWPSWFVCLFPFICRRYRLPNPSDAPRRRLVVTWNSAKTQDETTESSAWFFNMLGVQQRHTGSRLKVSPERQSVILTSPGIEPTYSSFQVERSNLLSYAGWWPSWY